MMNQESVFFLQQIVMCKRFDRNHDVWRESDIKILFWENVDTNEFFEDVRVFRESVLDERVSNGVEANSVGEFACMFEMWKEKFFKRVNARFEESNAEIIPVHTEVFRVRMNHARHHIERRHYVRQTLWTKKLAIVCHTVRVENLVKELFDTVREFDVSRLNDLKI